MIEKRVEMRLEALHDFIVAYAGTQKKFSRRSGIPTQSIWQAYELMKYGITPEGISFYLRLRYPTDFNNSGIADLLSLVLKKAQEEYLGSGHVIGYDAGQADLAHRKN